MRKIYGYARVSTREQNLDRQIIALQQYGISDRDIVTDKESGKTLERDGYTFLKNRLLRDGDVLVGTDSAEIRTISSRSWNISRAGTSV